ncbi:MAG: glycosyltransferase [Clostridium sp.]|nr:glycosyltransferase [Acetatifactor muris]MCM1526743.1 glycosyltransferase [Bacteroides sp.]MCM1562797.1 glycosyltransferase [Clostridium sp.]
MEAAKQDGLVSIIVPVYNVEKYIVEAIESVRRQTYDNWELLLVEDGSTDDTGRIMEEYGESVRDDRIRILRQPENRGAAEARNRGVTEARGRYIAYLDSDDLWEPEKLERELAFMRERQAAFAFTGYEFADESGKGMGKVVHVPRTLNYKQALRNTTIFTTTVMFDTARIPKEMLQMPKVKSEDTALWWKVLRNGYIAWGLDENLVKYRRAGSSLSSNKLEAVRRIWNLYRKVEGLSVPVCMWNFGFWAVRAVWRRV